MINQLNAKLESDNKRTIAEFFSQFLLMFILFFSLFYKGLFQCLGFQTRDTTAFRHSLMSSSRRYIQKHKQ